MVLADLPYSILCARSQASCALDVFSKNEIENAVSSLTSVMATGAQGHTFRFGFMFSH